MKRIAQGALVLASSALPTAVLAQEATPIETGVSTAFTNVTDVINTAGPLLMGVAAAVVVVGVAVRMIRKAG